MIGDLPDSVRVGFGQIPKLILCGPLCHMVCDLSTHTLLRGNLLFNNLEARNLIEKNQNHPCVNCAWIAKTAYFSMFL